MLIASLVKESTCRCLPIGRPTKATRCLETSVGSSRSIARTASHLENGPVVFGRHKVPHYPTLETHGKMLRVFEPIRKTLVFGKSMTAVQMVAIINARRAVQ